jgi:AcrR family transcriptional regulator
MPAVPHPAAADQRSRKDLLISSVVTALSRRLEAVSDDDLEQVDPQQVAERVAALIPTPHPFAQLGPFYPTTAVAKWLGITRQALDQRVRSRKMLGCPTADGGQRVYPVWQFTEDGQVISHLAAVLDTLHEGIDDPWTWATWLAAPVAGRFDGLPAYRWLAEGRDPEQVLLEARRTAGRLAQ